MTDHPSMSLTTELSNQGFRLTRQRRILLNVLENTPTHLTARNLLREAQQIDPTINRATVYRMLALLKQAGLIDELDLLHLQGEEHYYERRRPRTHLHIGCGRCGTIQEMETELIEKLAAEIRQRTGCSVSAIRVEVRGVCPACQQT